MPAKKTNKKQSKKDPAAGAGPAAISSPEKNLYKSEDPIADQRPASISPAEKDLDESENFSAGPQPAILSSLDKSDPDPAAVSPIENSGSKKPSSVNDPSNRLFQLAVQFVNQTAKHLFLTGKAGTGKTTFLKYIKENTAKKMAIMAPTGVAAINAGGVTIHSFFQLPFGPFVPTKRSGWNPASDPNQYSLFDEPAEAPSHDPYQELPSEMPANQRTTGTPFRGPSSPDTQQGHGHRRVPAHSFQDHAQSQDRSRDSREAINQHSLFKNIRFNADKKQLLQELEMIVIDEVSMLRADMLDAIDLILRHFRQQPLIPFGGVQMVFIGDLFQLPPVINQEEWEILKNYYRSPFFFDAQAVHQSPPVYLELKKIYRQNDAGFIHILNNIRNNKAEPEDLALLHRYYQPAFQPSTGEHYIVLTSHNAKADAINRKELEKLTARSFFFPGVITGDFNEKALPVDKNLQLKTGAQIMFLKNDKGEKRRYYNGKIGQVTRIKDQAIFVGFPGDAEEIEVEKETWKNIRYRFDHEKNKIEEEELGTFTQYPIRLAWAITIHKSQGLTFEKAIIDAGASFAAGQVYVALSRLTSLDGLVLHSRIRPDCISTDERVLDFIRNGKQEEILDSLLQKEQLLFTHRQLIQSFEWAKLSAATESLLESYPGRKIPLRETAVRWAEGIVKKISGQQEVAEKFRKQLDQLLADPDSCDYTLVCKRIQAAEQYFKEDLSLASAAFADHIKEYTSKQKVKSYIRDLEKLHASLRQKTIDIKNAKLMAEALVNGNNIAFPPAL
mgnify:CR=1 FL=1